jgi:hypothetical protein
MVSFKSLTFLFTLASAAPATESADAAESYPSEDSGYYGGSHHRNDYYKRGWYDGYGKGYYKRGWYGNYGKGYYGRD